MDLALVAGLLVHVLLPVSMITDEDDVGHSMFPVGVAIISYGIQFKYRTWPFKRYLPPFDKNQILL